MFNGLGTTPLILPKTEPIYDEERIPMDINGKTQTNDMKLQSILPRPTLPGLQGKGKGRGVRPSMAPIGNMNPANMCKICGKWFRSRQQVSQHLLVHTDERRYKCNFCDRAFKQASHLQQHHRIHTGEKPYRCPLPGCERAFPQLSNLNHHLRNHDKPEPPASNTCIYCDRVYASETVMKTHIEKMHMAVNGDIKPVIPSSPNTKMPKMSKPSVLYSSENFVKIAPAPLPSMTVAPPVLNFSQAFFQPYLHELNLVQLPKNMIDHGQLPVDSKMTLPVSLPKLDGESFPEKGTVKFSSDSQDKIHHQNGPVNGNQCSSTQGKPREGPDNPEPAAESNGTDYSLLTTQMIVNQSINTRAMNNVIKAVNAAKMFKSDCISGESESDTDEEFDCEINGIEDMPEDCKYSYTLDSAIQENRHLLRLSEQEEASKENDNQKLVTNGFKKSQTPDSLTPPVSRDSNESGSVPLPQQTHSRKRKAFRPQRVVHEKVFIPDDDI